MCYKRGSSPYQWSEPYSWIQFPFLAGSAKTGSPGAKGPLRPAWGARFRRND